MKNIDIQKDFFYKVNGTNKSKNEKINVYKYLVYTSFFELISNAFPLFYKEIKKKKLHNEFEKSIKKFIKKSPKTLFIWKMANEYRKFLKKQSFFKDIKYTKDLLYYEHSELRVFMQRKTNENKKTFSINKKYALNKNIDLKHYKYNVLDKTYKKVNDLFILAYFDEEVDDVVFRNINEAVYIFLKEVNSIFSLNKNINQFFTKNNFSKKEYKKDFVLMLEELESLGVIKR